MDHLIPQRRATAKAGRCRLPVDEIETEENYMSSCRSCNHYKRAHSLETFRRYLEEIPMKLTRDNYIYKIGLRYDLIEEHPRKIKFYFEQMEELKGTRIDTLISKVDLGYEKVEEIQNPDDNPIKDIDNLQYYI